MRYSLGICLLILKATSTLQQVNSKVLESLPGDVRHLSESTCNLVIKVVSFEDGTHLRELECVLPSDGIFRSIENKPGWLLERLSNNQIASNIDTLYMSEAIIHDTKISIPSGADIYIEERNETNDPDRRRLVTGTRNTIALRIVATDAATTMTVANLGDEIFGASGDSFNMRSQYLACSFNQLDFAPGTQSGVTNGVFQVTPPNLSANGADHSAFRTAVVNEGNAQLGTMSSSFEHVMLCFPPGVTISGSTNWVAYAYVNSYLSVYNDNWCGRPSACLHEIGHNINLAHSNESGEYRDQTGMMGYSYNSDDGPIMCFNGPKTWQLGWFPNRHVTLASGSFSWSGNLVGFVDYENTDSNDKMIIMMDASSIDYYISFNRATGINSGTVEASNQVVVHSKTTSASSYGASELLAKLAEGSSYEVGSTTITFNSLATTNGVMRASITIGDGNNSPTPAPTPAPTPSAPSPQPSGFRIKSALGNYCVKPKDLNTNSKIVIATCQASSDFYWQYNEYGQIKSLADTSKCLTKQGKKKLKLIPCTASGTISPNELFGYNSWDGTLFWKKRHMVMTLRGGFAEGKVLKVRRAKYPVENNQAWEMN